MKKEIENYRPSSPQYVIDEAVREEFPTELDFKAIPSENLKTKREAMKFIGSKFTATFPEAEYVTRLMDDNEKAAIRDEYCQLVENTLPERKRQLEEALEEAKRMKKEAEERYASALQEVASMAAEVKMGTVEEKLSGSDTFCIALAGYYLTYTWNEQKQVFVLAKAYEVQDASDMWASDTNNREQMLELFGVEMPEFKPRNDNQFDGEF